jgi:hypothetical protein
MRRYGECALADLLNSNESWPDDIACRQTEWLIDQLFPDALLLACGKSLDEIRTRSRETGEAGAKWASTVAAMAPDGVFKVLVRRYQGRK